MLVQPYLFFNGNCDEALAFYEKALSAKIRMKLRVKDAPDQTGMKRGAENMIMHAQMDVAGNVIMASDMCMMGTVKPDGFALSITAGEAEVRRMFQGLEEGGKVRMPLGKTFFSPLFGQLTDKFGIQWMLMVG